VVEVVAAAFCVGNQCHNAVPCLVIVVVAVDSPAGVARAIVSLPVVVVAKTIAIVVALSLAEAVHLSHRQV
jgi:hypothetical protein